MTRVTPTPSRTASLSGRRAGFPRVTLAGAGAVGQTLAAFLDRGGAEVTLLVRRDPGPIRVGAHGRPRFTLPLATRRAAAPTDVLVLCVPFVFPKNRFEEPRRGAMVIHNASLSYRLWWVVK